jgi:hypothetical protein
MEPVVQMPALKVSLTYFRSLEPEEENTIYKFPSSSIVAETGWLAEDDVIVSGLDQIEYGGSE